MGVADWLFDPSGLAPHGFCLLWNPGLVWLHALSDGVIGLAYFTIPFMLRAISQCRPDFVMRPVLGLFAAFILLCGLGHWMELLTLWVPIYGLAGLTKALTAAVSVGVDGRKSVSVTQTWRPLNDRCNYTRGRAGQGRRERPDAERHGLRLRPGQVRAVRRCSCAGDGEVLFADFVIDFGARLRGEFAHRDPGVGRDQKRFVRRCRKHVAPADALHWGFSTSDRRRPATCRTGL